MRRAALVNAHGVVEQVVILGEGYVPPDGLTVLPSETANIGDVRDGAVIVSQDTTAVVSGLLAYARAKHQAWLRRGFLTRLNGFMGPVRVSLTWENRIRLVELSTLARVNSALLATWADHVESWEAELSAADILEIQAQALGHIETAHVRLKNACTEIRLGTAKTRGDVDAIIGG